MKETKRKRLIYLTIALGVLVLAIAGYASRDVAVEQWYIWKLASEDPHERKLAVRTLGDLRSIEAIPGLLGILRQWPPAEGPPGGVDFSGEEAYIPAAVREAIEKIGRPAVSPLIELLQDKKWAVRLEAAIILGRIGPEAKDSVSALTEVLRDDDQRVRRTAAYALANIALVQQQKLLFKPSGRHWKMKTSGSEKPPPTP